MLLMTEEKYLTVAQVARVLQLHPETVKELLRKNQLPGRKVGKQWRVSQTALEEFIRGKDSA